MNQTTPFELADSTGDSYLGALDTFRKYEFLQGLAGISVYTFGSGDAHVPSLELVFDSSRKEHVDEQMLQLRDRAVQLLSSGQIDRDNKSELLEVISQLTSGPHGTGGSLELSLAIISSGLADAGANTFLDITTAPEMLEPMNRGLLEAGDLFHTISAAIVLRDLRTQDILGLGIGIRTLRPTRQC
jgi:hypothetical protein